QGAKGSESLSITAMSRADRRVPEAVPRMRLDAEGILKLVLARLDDRKVEDLHKAGIAARVEGVPHCDWVLIDAGDVIVHVFRPEVRTFYNLERMWASGPAARRAS